MNLITVQCTLQNVKFCIIAKKTSDFNFYYFFLLANKGKDNDELVYNKHLLEMAKLKTENNQLQIENGTLRNKILALNSEVYGAKLAAKYLDKELAGRIQQLQLLGKHVN